MLKELLGSELRARLLSWLFTHPDESFYVRQLAGLLDSDSTNVSREFSRLADIGVLSCTVEGRQKHYSANEQCSVFNELRGLVVKTEGVAGLIREALESLTDAIAVSFVYGSMAEGRLDAVSDVDLMVVGEVGFGEVVGVLADARRRLGREVSPTVYPPREFSEKLARGQPFLREVMAGDKLFVIGDSDDLERLAKERVAD